MITEARNHPGELIVKHILSMVILLLAVPGEQAVFAQEHYPFQNPKELFSTRFLWGFIISKIFLDPV